MDSAGARSPPRTRWPSPGPGPPPSRSPTWCWRWAPPSTSASVSAPLPAGPGGGAAPAGGEGWVPRLSAEEQSRREAEQPALRRDSSPIHPARIYGELAQRAEPDAMVVVDGGDFGSYAGKFVDTETPGCFLDPGPYGCLGTAPGYGLAARLAHPARQVFLMLGDGRPASPSW